MAALIALFTTMTLIMVNLHQRSFVDTAPALASLSGAPEAVGQYQDDAVVTDLENLKNTLGKSLEMMKSHEEVYTNINGFKESHSDTKEQLNQDGKLVAKIGQQLDESPGPNGKPVGKVRTNIDIPSKGIHKTMEKELDSRKISEETENGNRRTANYEMINAENIPRYVSDSGIQYSPLDMAEYVFWTGDERGVTQAIEEFLQEGLMTREEAIAFLQDIKYNLDYLQKHYTEVGLNTRERIREKENVPNGLFYNNFKDNNNKNKKSNQYNTKQLKTDKRNSDVLSNLLKEQNRFDQSMVMKQNEHYDELLERLRVADFLYTEYSLEEVIYQLAKVMFTQSLTRGSVDAQQSLQKFTTFLESEAEQGRISRALEKKVLDVLIASLTDTLNEHPELQIMNKQNGNLPAIATKENLMKHLFQFNPLEDNSKGNMNLLNFADELKSSQIGDVLSNRLQTNGDKDLTLGIGKYKHN